MGIEIGFDAVLLMFFWGAKKTKSRYAWFSASSLVLLDQVFKPPKNGCCLAAGLWPVHYEADQLISLINPLIILIIFRISCCVCVSPIAMDFF